MAFFICFLILLNLNGENVLFFFFFCEYEFCKSRKGQRSKPSKPSIPYSSTIDTCFKSRRFSEAYVSCQQAKGQRQGNTLQVYGPVQGTLNINKKQNNKKLQSSPCDFCLKYVIFATGKQYNIRHDNMRQYDNMNIFADQLVIVDQNHKAALG